MNKQKCKKLWHYVVEINYKNNSVIGVIRLNGQSKWIAVMSNSAQLGREIIR